MARRFFVAGNWKMNNTIEQSVNLVNSLQKEMRDMHKVDIMVAPPFTAIKSVYDALSSSSIQVGAQDVFWEESGAYTGEVSPMMLKDAGCKWAIIGHSERRQYFGETDDTVNRKMKAALAAGLKAIVCVGETLEERDAGKAFDVLDRQVAGALAGLGKEDMDKIVIAYEPVWAIGTGRNATPQQADEAHAKIRARVGELFGSKTPETMRVLYGGSMKPANALELLKCENVDGGLIGGASLKTAEFAAIIRAAIEAS
ncbi:MAG: triose-phosphate isomerase [Nitrospinae bacterium]|nr:triose-phosphate isomerase [Nitrospinota bacterium]MBF0633335.1 triose-phosphate isomerase [Nitrospinota bacterium]